MAMRFLYDEKIVMHTQIKGGVDNVDKFLNENELSLSQVQIVFNYNPRGSYYMVFYEVEVADK